MTLPNNPAIPVITTTTGTNTGGNIFTTGTGTATPNVTFTAPIIPDADQVADDPDPQTSTTETVSPDIPDKGFPAKTPVAEMTPAQQAAYWKYQNRKTEDLLRQRSDYDELKTQVEQARQAGLTDQQRAVEEAREAGRKAALEDSGAKYVGVLMRASLAHRGYTSEATEAIVGALTATTFLTKDGEVDIDKVNAFAGQLAQAQGGGGRGNGWPDMGQGSRTGGGGRPTGVAAGAAMYEQDKANKKTQLRTP